MLQRLPGAQPVKRLVTLSRQEHQLRKPLEPPPVVPGWLRRVGLDGHLILGCCGDNSLHRLAHLAAGKSAASAAPAGTLRLTELSLLTCRLIPLSPHL